MTARLNLGNRVPDRQRIAAVAIAVSPASFAPDAEGYERAKRDALQTQYDPRIQIKCGAGRISSVCFTDARKQRMTTSSRNGGRFAKEVDEINKRSTPYPGGSAGASNIAGGTRCDAASFADGKRRCTFHSIPSGKEAESEDDNKVKIDTSLVVVPVSVMDRAGKYVPV